jgi:hypothetical protein
LGRKQNKKTKDTHTHTHTKQNKTDENQSDYTSNTHKNKRGINPHPTYKKILLKTQNQISQLGEAAAVFEASRRWVVALA